MKFVKDKEKKATKKAPPAWTHPKPGELLTATVTEDGRVKRFRCTDAIEANGFVRLVAGERIVATVNPDTVQINYE